MRAQSEIFVNDVKWRYFFVDWRSNLLVGGGSIDLMNSAGVTIAGSNSCGLPFDEEAVLACTFNTVVGKSLSRCLDGGAEFPVTR